MTHRLDRYIGSSDPGWIEMFMTLDVPSGATRGRHEVQLYAPCDDRPELLAAVTVILGP